MTQYIKLGIASLLSLIIFFSACKKNSNPENLDSTKKEDLLKKFFSKHKVTDPKILSIIEDLEKSEKEFEFAVNVIEAAGYPKWDKALKIRNSSNTRRTTSNDTTESFIIPTIGITNQFVTGAIIVRPNETVPYHFVLLSDYAQHGLQKENFVKEMMALNFKTNGNNKYKVLNNSINNIKEVIFKLQSNSSITSRSSDFDPCEIIEIWYNPDGDACNCNGDEYDTGNRRYAGNCLNQETTSVILPLGGGLPPYYYPLVNFGGGYANPNPPLPYVPVSISVYEQINSLTTLLNLDLDETDFLSENQNFVNQIFNYVNTYNSLTDKNLARQHIIELINNNEYKYFVTQYNLQNSNTTNQVIWWKNFTWLNNPSNYNNALNYSYKVDNSLMTSLEIEDNYTINDYDNTYYVPYDTLPNLFPNTPPIISTTNFIGWGYSGVRKNCFDYAKKQIAIVGYKLSGYFDAGQTIQAYKHPNGADSNKCKQAIAYLYSAIQRGIPVVVGVDEGPGSPNKKTDNTTDHFVVIVGMGKDSIGNYFSFYDNATSDIINGTSPNNKLYINTSTWSISGTSAVYGPSVPYVLTMVRKSKP
jgi:hypothetical protein